MLRMKNLTVLVTAQLPKETKKKPNRICNPLLRKKRNYTHRQERKNWVEREELALARAYVDVSKNKQHGNQQSVASRRSEADVLQSLSKYRRTINQKSFPHQQAWEWLKGNVKWAFVTKAGEDSPPPSSKRTKTSSSNAYTSLSDPQYPPDFSP
ncbi:unnamed protein product [Lactuca saligna]|uniref:Uncharacterized protein n=1 Tax=Lactuca saligna TaxID=75948 RepID=A0AA36EDJ7_LACSI|nr:unnamed protein product [Lactuca saligna]